MLPLRPAVAEAPEHAEAPLRRAGIDVGRIAAAASVVGIHALASGRSLPVAAALLPTLVQPFLKWALPFFFVVAGFLHGADKGAADFAWLRRRALRLALPLLAWTAVFRVLAWLDGESRVYSVEMLLKDLVFGLGWSHLWFLPVLTGCAAVLWALDRWGVRLRVPLIVSFALAAGYVAVASAVPLNGDEFPTVYLYRTPMFWLLFYLAGARIARDRRDLSARLRRLALPVLVAGLLSVGASTAPRLGIRAFDLHVAEALVLSGSALVGCAAGVLALATKRGSALEVQRFARLSMGVYLLHPVAQYLIVLVLPGGFAPAAPDASMVAVWLAMYGSSAFATALLSRTKLRAFVV